MNKLIFLINWPGEPDAGLSPGSEEVTIQFKYGQPIDDDVIQFWLDVIQEFYDGAHVRLLEVAND